MSRERLRNRRHFGAQYPPRPKARPGTVPTSRFPQPGDWADLAGRRVRVCGLSMGGERALVAADLRPAEAPTTAADDDEGDDGN